MSASKRKGTAAEGKKKTMPDDIVTRLREYEAIVDHPFVMSVLVESADEIERLRAAIRHLYFNEGVCYGENCEQCELVFGLCDNQAVRGE